MFVLCLFVSTYTLSQFTTLMERASLSAWLSVTRAFNCLQSFFAMCMAWCFQRAGEWQAHLMIEEISMAQVASGFSLTAFSVLCVFIVDKIADNSKGRSEQKE